MAVKTSRTSRENKINDLKETEKIVKYQQQHYNKLLNNFDIQIGYIDERIVDHEEEIRKLQDQKDAVRRQFIEAPERLIVLAQQLKDISDKRHALSRSEADTEKRVQRLKERIATLRQKLNTVEAGL